MRERLLGVSASLVYGAAPLVAPLLVGCSVLFDPPPVEQCRSDVDCPSSEAGAGGTCDVATGLCVAELPLMGPDEPDVTMPRLCRTPSSCVSLRTPECVAVSGAWQSPGATFLGTIGPHAFLQADGSEVTSAWTARSLQSLELGLEEWNRALASGLPQSRSPLALIHCNSKNDPVRARRAASHLLDVVGARVVFPIADIDRAAIAEQIQSSNATSLCLGCYDIPPRQFSPRRSWNVLPPLAEQAPLAAWRVKDLEARLLTEQTLAPDEPLRVVLLSQAYPGVDAYIARVRELLRPSGEPAAQRELEPSYLELQTPEPRLEAIDYIGFARTIAAFVPHVLVAAVDQDLTEFHLPLIEATWSADRPRPFYVATWMNEEAGLFEPLVRGDDDLRQRISGTGYWLPSEVAFNARAFSDRFAARFLEAPENAQVGYDAFYAAAYALFVADLERTFGSDLLERGITRLIAGAPVAVDPSLISTGLQYIVSGQTFDLVGTATPLTWNIEAASPREDIGVWCLVRDDAGQLVINPNAGPRWTAASNGMTGSYDCP